VTSLTGRDDEDRSLRELRQEPHGHWAGAVLTARETASMCEAYIAASRTGAYDVDGVCAMIDTFLLLPRLPEIAARMAEAQAKPEAER
jgi:hypothetical protein